MGPVSEATLQSRLEEEQRGAPQPPVDPDGEPASRPSPPLTEPVALLRGLEESGRFHRDSGFGRIFHPGRVSFRENVPTDSLHVVVKDNHIAAHVDRVSPLGASPESQRKYSVRRAVAHNLAGAAHDFLLLLQGRQGDHRCELDCEWLWDPSANPAKDEDLLDPRTTAWSLQIEARVSGSLDEARLRRALDRVFEGQPGGADVLTWVECPDDEAVAAARADLQSHPAAIGDRPPLRAVLARSPGGDMLMLNVNHGAADGVAAMDLLRAVADSYAGIERGPFTFLAAEDLPVRPASAPVSALGAQFRSAVERLRELLARPARLAPDGEADEAGYGFHVVRFSVDDTRRAINRYRASTSRNVLVASLHLAIADWNRRHGSTPGRRIGVLLPVNLRPPDWRMETIANCTITARISTSTRHRTNRTAALTAVRTQATRNKRTRTGIALLAALERSGLLPLWAKQSLIVLQPLTRYQEVDTAMLSYLGWLHEPPSFGSDAGDTEEVWFSPPARTPSSLSIGAVAVAGRLHLVFRYPHRLFSPEAVRRFADCYLASLRVVSEGRS